MPLERNDTPPHIEISFVDRLTGFKSVAKEKKSKSDLFSRSCRLRGTQGVLGRELEAWV